ncbi:ParB N-terminal domain-containing protein [Teichococcus deserti]|uniref:ParB N-terminal domain-containing protein n=1 Tax=Teichococcus deserti TaxID=1817963 RepID=UPI00346239D6
MRERAKFPLSDYASWLLVAGHHRLEACRALGYSTIPAVVMEATSATPSSGRSSRTCTGRSFLPWSGPSMSLSGCG